MSPYSTREVAETVGIHVATLEEWLSKGKVKSPRTVQVGAKNYRLWSERDVERVRKYKEKFYRKGRGRKKKKKNGKVAGAPKQSLRCALTTSTKTVNLGG